MRAGGCVVALAALVAACARLAPSATAGGAADAGAGEGCAGACADAGSAQGGTADAGAADAGAPAETALILPEDPAAPSACGAGWCWANPRPFGADARSVSTTSPADVWIGSSHHLFFHFDGATWTASSSGNNDIEAVVSLGPDDAWAAVNETKDVDGFLRGRVLHWDGKSWTSSFETDRRLLDVWASRDGGVWISGYPAKSPQGEYVGDGLLAHFDGTAWSVAATDITRVISTGAAATTWMPATFFSPNPGELFVTGIGHFPFGNGSFFFEARGARLDGSSWTEVDLAPIAGSGNQRWVFTRFPDLTGVSFGAELSDWSASPPVLEAPVLPAGLHALYESEGRTFAIIDKDDPHVPVGHAPGFVAEYDGARFAKKAGAPVALTAIGGDGTANGVWAVGRQGALISWDGSAYRNRSRGPRDDLHAVFAASEREQWAAGPSGLLLHGEDGLFEKVESPASFDLLALGGTGPADVWAAGDGASVLHYDGTSWKILPIPAGSAIDRVVATSRDDVWLLREADAPLHWNGQDFTPFASLASAAIDAWGSDPDDVWFVLQDRLAHWDGRQLAVTPMQSARAIAGSGPDDVWVAGQDLSLHHFDGRSWSLVRPGETAVFYPVWVRLESHGPSNVALADSFGRVDRFDGRIWTPQSPAPATSSNYYFAMSLAPDGTVWMAGFSGTIVRSVH